MVMYVRACGVVGWTWPGTRPWLGEEWGVAMVTVVGDVDGSDGRVALEVTAAGSLGDGLGAPAVVS